MAKTQKSLRPRRKSAAAAQRPAPRKPGRRRQDGPKRTPSPDTLLAEASRLAKKGKVAEAIDAAAKILQAHPDHWPTVRYLWLFLWKVRQFDVALTMGREVLARGTISAKDQEGLAAYFLPVAHDEAVNDPTLVPQLIATIDLVAGLAGNPRMSGLLQTNLQGALCAVNRLPEALKVGMNGLALYPKYAVNFHHGNSSLFFAMGQPEEAVAAAARKLSPWRGKTKSTPAKIARQYKDMAATYDANTLHQSYGRMMAQLIVQIVGATAAKRVLDAGCGTGSLGAHIKAARLVGIDLSPDMLAQARARERNVYHELIEGDLVRVMGTRTDRFDIVASAVVLYHIPDLDPFFREAARLLVPSGHLFFSVDPAADDMDIGVSPMDESFAHSRAYLRRLAAQTGFAEIAIKIMPHRGNPGFWCAFRREG